MFEGYGPTSRLMSFPSAIIVDDVPAQLPAAAHMARTDARPTTAGRDRATRATSAPRIRRDFSLRKGSARKPQRLPRHRFLRRPPLNVTGAMEPRSRLAVRNLLPILPRDDRLTTEQTGGERIGDQAIANSGVDPLALVTDGGGLDHNRLDRPGAGSGSDSTTQAAAARVTDQRRGLRHLALEASPRPSLIPSPVTWHDGRFPSRSTASRLRSGWLAPPNDDCAARRIAKPNLETPPRLRPHSPFSTRAACCAA